MAQNEQGTHFVTGREGREQQKLSLKAAQINPSVINSLSSIQQNEGRGEREREKDLSPPFLWHPRIVAWTDLPSEDVLCWDYYRRLARVYCDTGTKW